MSKRIEAPAKGWSDPYTLEFTVTVEDGNAVTIADERTEDATDAEDAKRILGRAAKDHGGKAAGWLLHPVTFDVVDVLEVAA